MRGVAGPETTRGELTICMLNVTYMIAMVATTVDGVISEEGVRWGGGKGGRGERGALETRKHNLRQPKRPIVV